MLHAHGDNLLGMSAARGASGIDGTAPLTTAGFTTTLGRWSSREAFELGGAGGVAFGSRRTSLHARPLARGRAAATLAWLGLSGDVATVRGAMTTRRTGSRRWVACASDAATACVSSPTWRRATASIRYSRVRSSTRRSSRPRASSWPRERRAVRAWSCPGAHAVTTSVGADGDATHHELVAARAGLELRDRCGCLTLRVMGAHRLGREGVDVWLALDFAADR